jgi:DNA polymerase-3 subunit beta
MIIEDSNLKLQANNPEQEEAEEQIDISYSGYSMEFGFNVNYLLDLTSVINGDIIQFDLSDPESSVLVRSPTDEKALYVVMPMRI